MERLAWGKSWPEKDVTEFLDQISSAGDGYRRLVERLPAIVYACELGRLGCDYAQGHLFSRALPPEIVTDLLGEGPPAIRGSCPAGRHC
jgi:hypothetical protein